MGKLYVLATPIGNLDEVNSLLTNKLETLKVLFCEDTRVTKRLLDLLKIKNKDIELISYHKFNESKKQEEILDILKKQDAGLISDAGYPCINDPGNILIKQCHKNNIEIRVINGSCAINHAIVQSGLSEDGFCFIGFLPRKMKQIKELIINYFKLNLAIVFFESVHRINETLTILKESFPQAQLYIGRELTKKFEEYYFGLAKDAPIQIEKGEFCLVIKKQMSSNKNNDGISNQLLEEIINDLELMKPEIKIKDGCKYLARKYNLNPTDIYNYYLKNKS